MSLFRLGDVTLHSGARSDWKVDCDALADEDWRTLAQVAARVVPAVRVLLVDDVLTTGRSLEELRREHDEAFFRSFDRGLFSVEGLVAFARGPCPSWVRAVWTLDERCR